MTQLEFETDSSGFLSPMIFPCGEKNVCVPGHIGMWTPHTVYGSGYAYQSFPQEQLTELTFYRCFLGILFSSQNLCSFGKTHLKTSIINPRDDIAQEGDISLQT